MNSDNLKLRKIQPERLRSMGLNELWLQEQIERDPSLLGLGELFLIKRERNQPSGGRIDFLMYDQENDTRYEIEVMLGEVDESHIIRTIEYWDIERQRYPTVEHRAVIVAEEITSRFFNVIRLLNRAVPIIAIQLSAFRLNDGEITLQFLRVLDTYETGAEGEADEPSELVDRVYWEKKSRSESLAVVEAVQALAPAANGPPRITFSKAFIAMASTGYKYCWFYPRQNALHCAVRVKVDSEQRADMNKQLEEAGIDAIIRESTIRLMLTLKDVEGNRKLLSDVLRLAEEFSHR
jgi:hypothetical protein